MVRKLLQAAIKDTIYNRSIVSGHIRKWLSIDRYVYIYIYVEREREREREREIDMYLS